MSMLLLPHEMWCPVLVGTCDHCFMKTYHTCLITKWANFSFSFIDRFSIPLDLSTVPAIDQFVGRNRDLQTLWSLLQPSASTLRKVVVLHGLGGIGKTQLAIRFARLHQADFSAI